MAMIGPATGLTYKTTLDLGFNLLRGPPGIENPMRLLLIRRSRYIRAFLPIYRDLQCGFVLCTAEGSIIGPPSA
jgi:hypothetical protein